MIEMEDNMANQLLEVKGLSVSVEDKEILHGVSLR